MNRVEMVHNERKEHWRGLIAQCEASGMTQQEWCRENQVCNASMSKWRTTIWREEIAQKEFAAVQEEHCFVEVTVAPESESSTATTLPAQKKSGNRNHVTRQTAQHNQSEAPQLMKPDAVIGYREFMVGVYEHTSN